MGEKFVGLRLDEVVVDSFKDIARKERKSLKDLHLQVIEEYIKTHGDGNPNYSLDHFEHEGFLATPAYHRPLSAWESYLKKCSDKHYKEWTTQLESLLNLEKRITKQR